MKVVVISDCEALSPPRGDSGRCRKKNKAAFKSASPSAERLCDRVINLIVELSET